MVSFGVVAGVGQQDDEAVAGSGLSDHGLELQVVRLGAAIDQGRQKQVAAGVDDGGELGITVFLVAAMAAATPRVVDRAVAGFQAGGIDGRRGRVLAADQALMACLLDGGGQETVSAPFFRSRLSA